MKARVKITKNPAETKRLARDLVKELLLDSRIKSENDARKKRNDAKGGKKKRAVVIGLEGELGSAKTTFIQGMAEELGIKEAVNSPTFVIFKKYAVNSAAIRWFYHFDCYRIDSEKDILALGFKEIVSQPENLVVIEWAEKIKKILPKDCLIIRFSHLEENKRRIEVMSSTSSDNN